jgi:DNA-binding MarR family transcriptional regulator
MPTSQTPPQALLLSLADTWSRLERRLDHALSGARGIRFAEYRMLRALADAPGGGLSRVDLASAVGLTPSGVTRALQPLEKLHIVATTRSERDARLALAALTDAGRELVSDASGVLDDVAGSLLGELGDDPRVGELHARLAL